LPEEIENHSFKYLFQSHPDGIIVRAGWKFDWSMSMYGENVSECYFAQNDNDDDYLQVENQDMGMFRI
jgi:hypothetical protein